MRNSRIIFFFLVAFGVFLLIYAVASTFIYEFQYALTKDGIRPEEMMKQKLPYFYIGLTFIALAIIIAILKKRR